MHKQSDWNGKRYHSLDYYIKNFYGRKIYKLSLNGGMTCPNRDGTLGWDGCTFCSQKGSGEFASSSNLSITDQIEEGKKMVSLKMPLTNNICLEQLPNQYIAYFQAFTNTYASIDYLKKIFFEAINHPDILILSIATRPDCISQETLELLDELNKIKPVWIELGLQTKHEKTAVLINRGYPLSFFESAVEALGQKNIKIIVHVILGLPYETKHEMLETIHYLGRQNIQGIKLQLLCILKGSILGNLYETDPYFCNHLSLLNIENYIDTLISCIETLPPHIVIHRVTGDGPKNLLLAPLWCGNKKNVLNTLHKELKIRNTWQGKYFLND